MNVGTEILATGKFVHYFITFFLQLTLLFWLVEFSWLLDCGNVRVAAKCGGVINVASGASHTIKSPGYDTDRYYLSSQGCSWWIKVITTSLLLLYVVTLKVPTRRDNFVGPKRVPMCFEGCCCCSFSSPLLIVTRFTKIPNAQYTPLTPSNADATKLSSCVALASAVCTWIRN